MAIELTYSTTTITLPNPVFENSEQLNIKNVRKRTRGLITKIFRDPIWEKYTTLFYVIQGCSSTNVSEFKNFVQLSYGKEIILVDYEAYTWTGILLPGEITQQLRTCGFVIQFEFQGI